MQKSNPDMLPHLMAVSVCCLTVPPWGGWRYNSSEPVLEVAANLFLCSNNQPPAGSVLLLQKDTKRNGWSVSERGGRRLWCVCVCVCVCVLSITSSHPQWPRICAVIDYHHYSWSTVRSWHTNAHTNANIGTQTHNWLSDTHTHSLYSPVAP